MDVPSATHRREHLQATIVARLHLIIIYPILGVGRIIALSSRYSGKDRLDSRCTGEHQPEDG